MRVPLSILAASLLLSLSCAWGEEETVGIDLSLVSETTSVTASQPFTVALKVHHHPGYHTYWKSPGIVGVPFSIKWQLPLGFTAGEIQWPTPQQVDMAGHPAHGYERDILLLVDITPPAHLSKTVELKGLASWMACAAGCHPEEKTLTLNLPVATASRPEGDLAAAISKARAELPRPVTGWTASLESARDAAEIRVKFTRAPGNSADPGKLYFFSSDGQISSDPPQKIEPLGDGFRLIAVRSPYGPKDHATLPGVIVGEKSLANGQAKAATVEPAYPH